MATGLHNPSAWDKLPDDVYAQTLHTLPLSELSNIGRLSPTHQGLVDHMLAEIALTIAEKTASIKDPSLQPLKTWVQKSADSADPEKPDRGIHTVFKNILAEGFRPNGLNVGDLAPLICEAAENAMRANMSLAEYLQTLRDIQATTKTAYNNMRQLIGEVSESAARAKMNLAEYLQALKDIRAGTRTIRNDLNQLMEDKAAVLMCLIGAKPDFFAHPRLRDDDSVMATAIEKTGGSALRFASKRLQDDEGIVRLAVENDGLALQYASVRLQGTESIVRAAVAQNAQAIQHATPEMRLLFPQS